MSLTRRELLWVAGAGCLTLAGCTGGTGTGDPNVAETSQVRLVDSQFEPRNVHVEAGTAVTWTNDDDIDHTVTSASNNWDVDERVSGGDSVEHTFEESGVYDVYCRFHGSADLSGMSMKVGVGEATIESPLGGGSGADGGDGDGGGGYY